MMSQFSVHLSSITYLAGIVGFSLGSLARFATIWLGQKDDVHKIGLLTDQQHAHMRSELTRVRQEMDGKAEELASLLREKDDLREAAKAREKHTAETEHELFSTKKALEELSETLEQLRDQKRTQDERVQCLNRDVENVTSDLLQEKARHDDTRALLNNQAQSSLLTTADSLSGEEVVIMLEELNTEILQTAADMADAFEFGAGHVETEEARTRVTTLVGDRMLRLLWTTAHNEDPTIIQIALQACFVVYCEWIIGTWHQSHFPSETESFLLNLYESVREGEVQAVSGRWRSITRRQLRRMASQESDLASNLIPYVVDALVDVLRTAGCRGNKVSTRELIFSRFQERLRTIVGRALAINEAIGERISSGDLEPIHERPEVPFDPLTMDDAFPVDPSTVVVNGSGRTLCSTDLGLQRVEKVSKEGESEWHDTILLKPKVALESLLDGMGGA